MPLATSSTRCPRGMSQRSGADMRSTGGVMEQSRAEGPLSGSHEQYGTSGADGSWGVVAFVSVALALTLAAVATGLTGKVLPSSLASKVGYNSEGYLFALVLTPWVYYVARHPGSRGKPVASVLLGMLWLIIGWGLLNGSQPSAIKTLNVPALALGILVPYVALRRPLASWLPPALACGVVVCIGLGILAARPDPGLAMEQDNWVISLGEGVALILLTIVALDLVERWMLDPSAERVHWRWRSAFYAMLLATPITVSALGSSSRVGDHWSSMSLNYLGRIHEAFIGILLMCGTLLVVSWCERSAKLGVLSAPREAGR